MITCQIKQRSTPGGRTTEPDRDSNLRRGVQADPLRVPQPRGREMTHGRRGKTCKCPQENKFVHRNITTAYYARYNGGFDAED